MTTKTPTDLIKLLSDDLDAWLEAWLHHDGAATDLDIEFQWSLALVKEARAFLKQPTQ